RGAPDAGGGRPPRLQAAPGRPGAAHRARPQARAVPSPHPGGGARAAGASRRPSAPGVGRLQGAAPPSPAQGPRPASPAPGTGVRPGGLVIAIDGPSGAGKSTAGRELADRLGYVFLDTGAMYRALALAALRAGVALDDGAALAALAGRTG